MSSYWYFDISFWCHFPPNILTSTSEIEAELNISGLQMKTFLRKILKIMHILKLKCNCRRKSMQEKGYIMVVWCELKFNISSIPSLGITVWHHEAGIFSLLLTTMKDSYNQGHGLCGTEVNFPSPFRSAFRKLLSIYVFSYFPFGF